MWEGFNIILFQVRGANQRDQKKKLGFSYNWWAGGAQRGVGTRQKKKKLGLRRKKNLDETKSQPFCKLGLTALKKSHDYFEGLIYR